MWIIHEHYIYGLQTKIIERNNAWKKYLSEQNIINEITFNEGVEKSNNGINFSFNEKASMNHLLQMQPYLMYDL